MRYKRISDGTVQCIISKEDMEEFGLSITDIFERNEKGEDFLRRIISNAYEEVGYEANGGNIAMQITPMPDKSLIITFSDEGPQGFQNLLEHIKQALTGNGFDLQKTFEQLYGKTETDPVKELGKSTDGGCKKHTQREGVLAPTRVFSFENMNDVILFCKNAFGEQKLGSALYEDNDRYYLVLDKKRMSWKDFDLLSVKALDFADPVQGSEGKLLYLKEHGELVISSQVIGKLKKIF